VQDTHKFVHEALIDIIASEGMYAGNARSNFLSVPLKVLHGEPAVET